MSTTAEQPNPAEVIVIDSSDEEPVLSRPSSPTE
jgi:hypothetical protein